jgi:hypothetical protein
VEIKIFPPERSIEDKKVAPAKAPIPPGMANFLRI